MTREEKEQRIEQIREILEGMDVDYVAIITEVREGKAMEADFLYKTDNSFETVAHNYCVKNDSVLSDSIFIILM